VITIATWNVNSLKAREARVLAWLEANRPDVLCLQELKIEDGKFPASALRAIGYEAAVFGQRTYNGVAILSRTPLLEIEKGFADGVDDPQARLIAATTAGGIRVVSLYVPNGERVGSEKFTYKLSWFERLRDWLVKQLSARGANPALALCGDFNVAPDLIDVHDPVVWEGRVLFSQEERAALARLREVGLTDLVRHLNPETVVFTWWDYRMLSFPRNYGLRIDHILVTPDLAARARSARVDRDARKGKLPSDHAPVVVGLAESIDHEPARVQG
jgi:exodeoxyribonuclease-3